MPVGVADRVRISSGVIEGMPGSRPGIREFRGVPYAAPPVGPSRWAPPRPPPSWSGPRKAHCFGNRCVQTHPFPDMLFRSSAESEDCLYLSIWTPAETAQDRLPVLVWIHGGGFFAGASDEGRHEGSSLAAKGVVLVEVNYRLGVLGFLSHPELTAESDHRASGNYGLLDQVAALEWVHENIEAFGGDPGNVTVFGESAGSLSVSALMASPLTVGLFHRAIGQSGGYFSSATLPLRSLPDAEEMGAEFAAEVGVASLADLRVRPASDLIAAVGEDPTRFAPILDGRLLPRDPWEVFREGCQLQVPLLAGWNSAEVKTAPATVEAFTAWLRERFPEDHDALLGVYPAGNDREAALSAVALASDDFMGYSTWKWIELHSGTGGAPVFRYLFDQIVPVPDGPPPPDDPGAAHASEIEFVFNTLDTRRLAWREEDRYVADLMGSYWTNFARTGDPNGPGLPGWPAWDAATRSILRLRATPEAEPEPHRNRYLLLDAIEKRRRRTTSSPSHRG